MDFKPSPQVEALRERILDFMDERIYPQEREIMAALDAEVGPGVPYPGILVEVREGAKAQGLWNLFLPDERYGAGLKNWEYGVLCEIMGRSSIAPRHLQLQGARHRQHGDPRRVRHAGAEAALARAAAGRRDPQLLLDDRAGDRRARTRRCCAPAPCATATTTSSTATSGSPAARTARRSPSPWSSPIRTPTPHRARQP